MTRPAGHEGVGKEPVHRAGNSEIGTVALVEGDDPTIVVEVRHSTGTGACVDRDRDFFLRIHGGER
jgi:hypothetical protein